MLAIRKRGANGITHAVTVRVINDVYKRNLKQLALLPMQDKAYG